MDTIILKFYKQIPNCSLVYGYVIILWNDSILCIWDRAVNHMNGGYICSMREGSTEKVLYGMGSTDPDKARR